MRRKTVTGARSEIVPINSGNFEFILFLQFIRPELSKIIKIIVKPNNPQFQ